MNSADSENKAQQYVTYAFKNFAIALPPNHLLPMYQRQHRLYDRFLPHLAKYLEPGSVVIDVGANCGDTVAAMCDVNRKLKYICIEPDDAFFEFLKFNVLQIRAVDRRTSIKTIKSLVGKNITHATLEGIDGTKHAVSGSGNTGLASQTLDAILAEAPVESIRLLKSDVDGYDYDVLESAQSIIKRHSPMLFFECQFEQEFQKINYKKTMSDLELSGYSNWAIFDNFGSLLLHTNDLSHVFQLMEYVWRQNVNQATRTIYYFDILASTTADAPLLNTVLNDYAAPA